MTARAPAQLDLDWMLGDWRGAHGSEHWFRAGDLLYGVGLGDGFEVMIIEPTVTGPIGLTAMPGGAAPVVFTAAAITDTSIRFANPSHDDPQAIRYTRAGDTLTATVEGSGHPPLVLTMQRIPAAAAPGLETVVIADLLPRETLTANLITSRVSGELGMILGRSTRAAPTGEPQRASFFLMVLRRQPGGSWKLLFDVARPDPRPALTR
jgi:hypothetical protein